MKAKYTPGQWQPSFISGCCIGIETEIQPNYSQILCNTILPETDKEYELEKEEIEANMCLMSCAPELLEALQCLTKRYKELVNSGDCGFWKAEDEIEYSDAINAINKALGK